MNSNEELIDLRNQNKRLKNQNAFLIEELDDMKSRFDNLKRELEIMSEANKGNGFSEISKEKEMLISSQNSYLKMQLVSTVTEKQYLERLNEELKEKVNDLKYTNNELKALNEKLSNVHSKEVEIMKKQTVAANVHQENEKKLIKEKENLEKKLENCSNIVKEMEQYYVNELSKKAQALKNKEEELKQTYKEIEFIKNEVNRSLQSKQLEEMIRKQSQQKKWELKIEQIKEKYEQEISELKDNVKFLVCKIEGLQESNQNSIFLQTNTESILAQSKGLQSNSSN